MKNLISIIFWFLPQQKLNEKLKTLKVKTNGQSPRNLCKGNTSSFYRMNWRLWTKSDALMPCGRCYILFKVSITKVLFYHRAVNKRSHFFSTVPIIRSKNHNWKSNLGNILQKKL